MLISRKAYSSGPFPACAEEADLPCSIYRNDDAVVRLDESTPEFPSFRLDVNKPATLRPVCRRLQEDVPAPDDQTHFNANTLYITLQSCYNPSQVEAMT